MRSILLALASLGVTAQAVGAEYKLSQQGKPTGTLTVTVNGPNRTIIVAPRESRQPTTRTSLTTDASGRLALMNMQGTGWGGTPIFERLRIEAGRARWDTGIDKGESTGPGYYVPLSLDAEQMAVLARALLSAPGGRLPVLPSGEVSVERGESLTLPNNIRAQLYLISGLGRRPVPVWLDEDRELIAQASAIEGATIRSDLEAALPRLIEVQEKRIVAAEETLARSAVERPIAPVLIRNANLYDAENARMRPGTDVLIRGDRIAMVGRRLRAPPGSRVIDADGRTLLPGLWDSHVHMFDPAEAMIMVANGVTSARDMGNFDAGTIGWRKRFDSGELIGPRLLLAAVVDGPGKRDVPWAKQVSNAAEVDALIAKLAVDRFTTVKLFNNTPISLVPHIIEQAHKHGLLVGGHLPFGMTIEQAIVAGVDESTHFDFPVMNFLPPIARDDYGAMKRTPIIAKGLNGFDPSQPAVDRTIAAMRAGNMVLDPTMVAFEAIYANQPGQAPGFMRAYADRVPSRTYRTSFGAAIPRPPAEAAEAQAAFRTSLALLGRFAQGGVPIVAGGDAEPALMIPRELELYVQAGMTPLQALQTATIHPARAFRLGNELGSIAPGKRADLILVDGNAARDIGVIRNVVLVMKNGALHDLARLNAQVGMRPSPALARFVAAQGTPAPPAR